MNNTLGLTPEQIPENVYGHKKRLLWIMEHINKHAPDTPKNKIKILEIGCGTGLMISIPLASLGYDVTGVDTDDKSIDYANSINPYENAKFIFQNAEDLKDKFDFIILSEVLEHLEEPRLLLKTSHALLKEHGVLLITVPNGYGWFELESFLWEKLKLGQILTSIRLVWLIETLRWKLTKWRGSPYLSTCSTSPHVQRFTLRKIQSLIIATGFHIPETDGSTLFSGKFSNLLFTGFEFIEKVNNNLGSYLKPIACGYYICARKKV